MGMQPGSQRAKQQQQQQQQLSSLKPSNPYLSQQRLHRPHCQLRRANHRLTVRGTLPYQRRTRECTAPPDT